MRTRAVREGKGDRGLKTISLAPYLTLACIRGWGVPAALEVRKGNC